jgi:hypothetical protein
MHVVLAAGGLLHPRKSGFDLGDRLLAGELRRERRGGRLDRQPQLGELAQQIERELPLEQPAQDVGVEQVPAVARLDHRADLGPRAQQALGRQHLDRLARDRAAEPVRSRKLGLRRKLRLERAADDRAPQRLAQGVGQVVAVRCAHRVSV